MNVPNPAKLLDERFFDHRRRSSSVAGIVGGVFASALFLYRHYVNHVWNWACSRWLSRSRSSRRA